MAIDATKMTSSAHAHRKKRGRTSTSSTCDSECVSAKAAAAATAGGRRGGQCRLHPGSPGLLVSGLLVVLGGDPVAAPPPSFAFAAGPCAARPAVSGRCGVFDSGGSCVRDIKRAAATTARGGVCLMVTVGGDTEEEKMELAAEVG